MESPALWKALHNLSGLKQSTVSIFFERGTHLLQSQLHGEHTAVLPHTAHSISAFRRHDELRR